MGDVALLRQVAEYGPLWVIAAVAVLFAVRVWNSIPNFMAHWLDHRKARAAEKEADWTRLREEIARLDKRLQDEIERARVQREEQEAENLRCREDLSALREAFILEQGERMKLQRIIDGEGEVRQAAAAAAAEARLAERERKEKP